MLNQSINGGCAGELCCHNDVHSYSASYGWTWTSHVEVPWPCDIELLQFIVAPKCLVVILSYTHGASRFLFWRALAGVRSTKHRHHPPERTIQSHVSSFIQGEVIGFQVLLDSLHPCSTRASRWSLQFSKGKLLRSWHLFHLAFGQCSQTGRTAVLGQWPKGVVAWLSVSPHHSTHGGTIWFLTAFTNTVDWEHQSWCSTWVR